MQLVLHVGQTAHDVASVAAITNAAALVGMRRARVRQDLVERRALERQPLHLGLRLVLRGASRARISRVRVAFTGAATPRAAPRAAT